MEVIAWLLGGNVLLLRRRPSGQGIGSSILRAIRALPDVNPGKSASEARKGAARPLRRT
jgi:hypothetical protein